MEFVLGQQQGLLAWTEPMMTILVQGEVAIATLGRGAAAREQIGILAGKLVGESARLTRFMGSSVRHHPPQHSALDQTMTKTGRTGCRLGRRTPLLRLVQTVQEILDPVPGR